MEEILLLGMGSAIVAGVVYFAIRQTTPVVPFLYANARIQAKSKYLVSDQQWPSLIEAKTLPELTSALRETDYAGELEEAEDVKAYHLAIEKTFAKAVEEIKEATPDSIDPLFNAYLMFWEAKMLKTVYRSILTGQKLDPALVFPVGRVRTAVFSHLKDTETLADMKVVMAGTPYRAVFEKDYQKLEEFEAALDNFVFHHFVQKVKKTRIYDGDMVIDLLNFKFDIQNLLVLLKLEARNVPEEEREKYLIKNDTALYFLHDELIKAKDMREFVQTCSRLHYHEPLAEALEQYDQDGSLSHFERTLYKYFKTTVLKMEKFHFQGPYPLFTHLVKKELEMKNLMTVSKGIDSKMSTDEIRELIL